MDEEDKINRQCYSTEKEVPRKKKVNNASVSLLAARFMRKKKDCYSIWVDLMGGNGKIVI
jgi:hypothetical protein